MNGTYGMEDVVFMVGTHFVTCSIPQDGDKIYHMIFPYSLLYKQVFPYLVMNESSLLNLF